MNHIKLYTLYLFLFSLISFSCKKDDDENPPPYSTKFTVFEIPLEMISENPEQDDEPPFTPFNYFTSSLKVDVDGDNVPDFMFKCLEDTYIYNNNGTKMNRDKQLVYLESLRDDFKLLSLQEQKGTLNTNCLMLRGKKGEIISLDTILNNSVIMQSRDTLTNMFYGYPPERSMTSGEYYIPFVRTINNNEYLWGWLHIDYKGGPKSEELYYVSEPCKIMVFDCYLNSQPNLKTFTLGEAN